MTRDEAEQIVSTHTTKIGEYNAVHRSVAFQILGSDQYNKLCLDPIRNNGPNHQHLYPWNVVDHLTMRSDSAKQVTSQKIAGICIICRKPVYFLETHEDHLSLTEKSGILELSFGYGSEYDHLFATKWAKGEENTSRDIQLCGSQKICTFIHDECFKENNNLFFGVDGEKVVVKW